LEVISLGSGSPHGWREYRARFTKYLKKHDIARKRQHGASPKDSLRSTSTSGNQLVVRLSRRTRKKARSVDMKRASIGVDGVAGLAAKPA
jgi:hypothetical protein